MAERDRPVYCTNCGSIVQSEDRFCGVCGASIPQGAPDAAPTQVATTQAQGQQSAPAPRKGNGLILMVIAAAVAILILGGVVIAVMVPGRESIEPIPGVFTKVPEGWALHESSNVGKTVPDSDGEYEVVLVPEQYKNSKSYSDAGTSITLSTYSCGESLPDEVQVNSMSDSVLKGFDEHFYASGTMTKGKSVLDGRTATWNMVYGANAIPWALPGQSITAEEGYTYAAADYPTYQGSVSLELCVEGTDLALLYSVNGGMDKDEAPTAEQNASVTGTREKIHENIRKRYEANSEALIQVLKDLSIKGSDGPNNLDNIPLSIRNYDNALESPFQGKLENSLAATESPDGRVPGKGEDLSPEELEDYGVTEPNTGESTALSEERTSVDYLQRFVSEYYDAVSREDWSATYSMLDEAARQEFTEDEWVEAQTVREASANPSLITSATVEGPYVSETQYPFSTNVSLLHEDGTSETVEMGLVSEVMIDEASDYRRHLTDEDVSYLKGLIGKKVGGARASWVEPDSVTASGTFPSASDASGNTISYEPEKAVDGQHRLERGRQRDRRNHYAQL